MKRSATISWDQNGVAYRYDLWRKWADGPLALWIMLNPSTADAEQDDPTVRRCISFSEKWGYGQLAVVNLFAYQATNPKDLPRILPIARGPENADHIIRWLRDSRTSVVIAAWGASYEKAALARYNIEGFAFGYGHEVYCLGRTKAGHPRHPLYVKKDQPLELWSQPMSFM